MKTAKACTASAAETSDQSWIWVEESIPSLEEEIVAIELTVVYELLDASVLDTTEAEQVARKANQEYSNYLWQPVPCRDSGKFVVQGRCGLSLFNQAIPLIGSGNFVRTTG